MAGKVGEQNFILKSVISVSFAMNSSENSLETFFSIKGFNFHFIKGMENLDKEWKLNNPKDYRMYLASPPSSFIYFKEEKECEDFLEANGYHIHEGNYYQIFCIVKKRFGMEPSSDLDYKQRWFFGESTGPEFYDYKYKEGSPPSWAEKTIY